MWKHSSILRFLSTLVHHHSEPDEAQNWSLMHSHLHLVVTLSHWQYDSQQHTSVPLLLSRFILFNDLLISLVCGCFGILGGLLFYASFSYWLKFVIQQPQPSSYSTNGTCQYISAPHFTIIYPPARLASFWLNPPNVSPQCSLVY